MNSTISGTVVSLEVATPGGEYVLVLTPLPADLGVRFAMGLVPCLLTFMVEAGVSYGGTERRSITLDMSQPCQIPWIRIRIKSGSRGDARVIAKAINDHFGLGA